MTSPKVTIIDYGVGNILSVKRAFEHCGTDVTLTSNPEEILNSSRLVLPGVGAFNNAMKVLDQLNLILVIKEANKRKIPILGICLGMQLLFDASYEFEYTLGLGLIPGKVVPIPNRDNLGGAIKIPHIGWSSLYAEDNLWQDSLLEDIHSGDAFYFVHSFMAIPENNSDRLANCLYEGNKILAVVKRGNITGCQFHPEKSGDLGLKILKRFTL
jgi:imidazole glycerol-phosphate synthase subunit HisH